MTSPRELHPRQGRAGRPYKGTEGAVLSKLPRGRGRSVVDATAGNYSPMIPSGSEFGEADFVESSKLLEMGDGLIGQWSELQELADYNIRYVWKHHGGKATGGKPTLGKTTLASGLVGFFGNCDWVIWLAADWCQIFEFDDARVEALLYHELLHCVAPDGDDEKPALRGHDFEGFAQEIDRYGFWEDGLMVARSAVQGRLALDDDVP